MMILNKYNYSKVAAELSFALLFGTAPQMNAETLYVAAAANFSSPMREIAKRFEQSHGHAVKVSSGSSGKLYAQIHHGAPFQVFFSADQVKPQKLVEQGLAVNGSQFTYAVGKLVVWAPSDYAQNEILPALKQGLFARLALANPKLAPYGQAAYETLSALQIVDRSRDKWVMGENIAQTYQFVSSGNADLGFVSLSQVLSEQPSKGVYWLVPRNDYNPIRQDAVLLKMGEHSSAAKAFLNYIKQPAIQQLCAAAGYEIPSKN